MKTKNSITVLLAMVLLLSGCQAVSTRLYEVDTVGSIEIEVEGAYNQYPFGGATDIGLTLPGSFPIPIQYGSDGLSERVVVRIRNVTGAIIIRLINVGNQGGNDGAI